MSEPVNPAPDPGRPITTGELVAWFGEARPPFVCDLWLDADAGLTVGFLRTQIRVLGEGIARLRGRGER